MINSSSMINKLLESYNLSGLQINNRVVMAPLTRLRADKETLAANDMIALYYQQRASAGVIIAEGSQISPQGYGYIGSPGCYTTKQIEGWRKVTEAVHCKGGRIFLQLWHVGPFSHRLLQPGNKPPLSASPVTPIGEVSTPEGLLPYEMSREMQYSEIFQTIQDFAKAAQNAIIAGFDGVEIHGAHGYLIDQFIKDGTNKRKDEFGGSIQNRSRFLFLIIEEIIKTIPSAKVGIRLSPGTMKKIMADSKPSDSYGYIASALNDYNLAWLHISEMITMQERLDNPAISMVPYFRKIYKGTIISCGGHNFETADQMLKNGDADLIAFGKPFISNPDMVKRLQQNAPLAAWDTATFYTGGPAGYVDYPSLCTGVIPSD
jgi:N-ethylmaleimide reductase